MPPAADSQETAVIWNWLTVRSIEIATAVNGENKNEIVLVPAEGTNRCPQVGATVISHIDWERRYKLMRMHTACHLLSVVCPYPITSANVNESRFTG